MQLEAIITFLSFVVDKIMIEKCTKYFFRNSGIAYCMHDAGFEY